MAKLISTLEDELRLVIGALVFDKIVLEKELEQAKIEIEELKKDKEPDV